MKLKISKNIALSCIAMGGLLLSSCNDFLDREPLDQVTPTQYFNAEADLAAYTVSYYSFPVHSGWGVGTLNLDNGTDNQATSNANYKMQEETGTLAGSAPSTISLNRFYQNTKQNQFKVPKRILSTISVRCISFVHWNILKNLKCLATTQLLPLHWLTNMRY